MVALDFRVIMHDMQAHPQAGWENIIAGKSLGFCGFLRADVSKYRPEVYKSEKSKILKKIHKVALGKLLT